MTGNEYQREALVPASKTNLDDLLSFLGIKIGYMPWTEYEAANNKAAMIMAALGIAGEAGEVADYIKKAVFHKHTFDVDKLRGELGDVHWYNARLASAAGLETEDIMEGNIDKLNRRYEGGFSHEASINRTV